MGGKAKLLYKDKPVVGVDISATGLKVMAINNKMVVTAYGAVDLDPTKVQNSILQGDDYLATALKTLLQQNLVGHLPSNHAVVSVPTNRTYSRTMSLPLSAEQNLAGAVQLEAEQYIPIPLSELNMDYAIIGRDKTNLTMLLSAVPKKVVQTIVNACQQAGLYVVMVEPGISAAARLITATEEGHLPSIIIDVAAATTDIGLLDGLVRLTGGIAIGGHTFTLKISEKLKIGLEEAHQLKVHDGLNIGPRQHKLQKALEPTLDQIVAETRKIVRYYTERLGNNTKIEQIIIVGGGSNLPGLGDYITNAMLMPARIGNPWHTLSFGKLPQPTAQAKARLVTAAGLAIVHPKDIWA